MTKINSPRGHVLVMLLAAVVAAVIAAQHFTATSSADNPTLTGDFCALNTRCMSMTWNGVAYGTPNRAKLALLQGTYSLTVNDNSPAHDFALRSCPGSTAACDPTNPVGTKIQITTQAQMGTVTTAVDLAPGTYRLYCDVTTHEAQGMFVDFTVQAQPVVTNSLGGGTASVVYGGSISPSPTVSASDADTVGSGLTATASGLPAGLALSVTTTSGASTLPGTRAWAVTGSGSASPASYPVLVSVSDGDANVGTTSFTIVVAKAPLTVTADNKSRLFGASDPPLTGTLSGFVLGQTAATSDVTGSASCTTTAVSFSPPGDYPITCTVGSLSSTNYSFGPFVAGTLSVTSTGPCLTGTHSGRLAVRAGEAVCVGAGGTQTGSVTVAPGGSLDIEGGRITGPVVANGAAVVRICGATITGPLTITATTGPALLGGAGCDPNTVVGPVRVIDNTGGVEFSGNRVIGPLRITGNATPVHAAGNTVTGPVTIQP